MRAARNVRARRAYIPSMYTKYLPSSALLLSLLTGFAAAQDSLSEPEVEVLRARDGSELPAELFHLEVPENRRAEKSRAITLAVLRVRSPLEDPGPPVFFLAGGPGGSSIEAVRRFVQGGGARFFEVIGGDVVGIDQRGVGLSRPNLETSTVFGLPPGEPGDPEQELARIAKVCREEAARWRAEGVDLDGYNTEESADDIDAVRRALAYEKISLWGESYGTHLALATIRRHGDHVARALLAGPEGPDHTVKLPSYAQEGLERIAQLVAADEQLGAAIPDFLALVETVLDRLEEEPVFVDVDGTRVGIGKYDVQQALAVEIGVRAEDIARVPAELLAMEQGDFEELARSLLASRRTDGVWSAMSMAMDAASGMSKERAAQIAAEAPTCLLGDSVTSTFAGTAKAWGVRDLGPEFRAPLHSDVPILFVVGDLDSRTPVRNARELMEHLPNAHLIVVENAGHATPMGIPELRAAWSDFLNGREVTLTRVDAGPIRFAPPPGVEAAPPEGAVQVPAAALEACAGRYEFQNGMVFVIEAGANKLVATIPGRGDFDLWPRSESEFFCLDPNIPPLTFLREGGGRASAVEGGGVTGTRKD